MGGSRLSRPRFCNYLHLTTKPPNYPTTSRSNVREASGESGLGAFRKEERFQRVLSTVHLCDTETSGCFAVTVNEGASQTDRHQQSTIPPPPPKAAKLFLTRNRTVGNVKDFTARSGDTPRVAFRTGVRDEVSRCAGQYARAYSTFKLESPILMRQLQNLCGSGRDKVRPSQNAGLAQHLRRYGRAALRRGFVLQLIPKQSTKRHS